MRYAITYVSTADEGLKSKDIEYLLDLTKDRNNAENITGILLFSDGNFFQIIEGEKTKIDDLFHKIEIDQRHHGLIKIFGRRIKNAAYDGYETDFITGRNRYNQQKFEHYLNYLQVLDEKSKKSVVTILKAFLK